MKGAGGGAGAPAAAGAAAAGGGGDGGGGGGAAGGGATQQGARAGRRAGAGSTPYGRWRGGYGVRRQAVDCCVQQKVDCALSPSAGLTLQCEDLVRLPPGIPFAVQCQLSSTPSSSALEQPLDQLVDVCCATPPCRPCCPLRMASTPFRPTRTRRPADGAARRPLPRSSCRPRGRSWRACVQPLPRIQQREQEHLHRASHRLHRKHLQGRPLRHEQHQGR